MAYNVTNGNVEYGILLMGENMNVFEGGRAEYTVIKSQGNLFVHDGGVAVYSEVGDKAGVGKIIVESGGTASDINIKINGYLECDGGTISSVTITCDMDWFPQEEMAGGWFTAKNSVVHNVKVNEYGTFEVLSGSRVFNTVVKGSVDYENKKNGGKVTVDSKSTLYHTVIEHGGSVTVYGKIVDSIVEKGGSLTVSGVAENTKVKSGAVLTITGKHCGKLDIDYDATVNAEDGEINFSLVDRTTSDGFLVNSMALIKGKPEYTITVKADQKLGTYRLGKRAVAFNDGFTVSRVDEKGNETRVGSVLCNKSIVDAKNPIKKVLYSIVKDNSGQLFLKISSADTVLPTRPVAVANITKATNKNVTVTATFDSKSKIKLYKVGNGAWKTYKSPVEMKNNGMVYFRAADSAGNLSLVNSFRVNNIDRTAPVISKITAVAQNSTAALNISFKPDNSGISHCEITWGKKKMTIYPSGNLSANLSVNLTGLAIGKHTVSVVAYDTAGNKSAAKKINLTIKDVTPPSKVTTLYAPSVTNKYKGTFKWGAATDNSGKIAKYEIQLDNGKIYTSSKTSVSISNLTVGNHTYRVRAIDKDKNVGAWSAVKSFTVKDYTAPKISKLTATVKGYTATLKITATDNVKATKYVISYGSKSQTVTTNTATLTGLAVGKVAVSVVAYDAAGNKSAAKKINLTVKDSTPPSKVTTLYAPSVTNKYKGTFKWTAATDNSGKIAKYEIQLDNGKIYTSTKTTLSVSNLKVGKHTYRVRAIDKNKNVGAWSAVKSFTVKDMTAPATVSLTAKVSGNNATLTWKKPKDNVGVTKYVLKYGNKSVTLSGSATKYVIYGLNKGTYSYSMIAYDAAGNASKAKTGKITIKQPLAPARAAEALYAADFAAPEALFAPQTDILAYCNELKSAQQLSDVSLTLAENKKDDRSLFAVLEK